MPTPPSPTDRFIEAMGLIAQAEGRPRIEGQVHAYLIVTGAPRSLTEIADALSVSKASASTNLRQLATRNLVRRASPVGSRQDHWEIETFPNHLMLAEIAERFRGNAETIGEIARDFPDDQSGARGRVAHLADFFRDSAVFLDEWHDRLGPCDPADKDED